MSSRDAPKGDLRQLFQLRSLLTPYRPAIVLALSALLIAAGGMLLLGQGLRSVIDAGLVASDGAALNRSMLAFLVVVVLIATATFVRFYTVSWLGERVVADLRQRVFSHLLTLSPAFYDRTRTGEIVSRLTNDSTMLESVVGSALSMALRNGLLLIGGLVMLLVTSLKLTVFVLLAVPVVIVPILVFGRKVRKLSRDSQDRLGDVSALLDESIHEVRTLQAYGREPHVAGAFAQRIEAFFSTAKLRIRYRATLIAAVILLAFGAIGFILWTGGHDVIHGRISAGQLSAFVFYAVIVASSVGTLSEVIGELQRAAGALQRIQELLATDTDIRAPESPQALPNPPRGELQFSGVSFHYPTRPDVPALRDIDLQISPGERVALVGPSGAGKSTLFQLLLRYYDPRQGTICIDNVPIQRADPHELRARIALVPQDPVLFATSVRENVRFAKPGADDAQVWAALDAAHAREFVGQLPQGLDSELGERGVRLSGGQRQRLAIARALLADRPILLLDEATSALDAESERMVQQALDQLMQGRTTLIIAHRLATVRTADRLLVMDQGRIVATGTHDELVAGNALYARLAALQFNA